MGSYEQQPEILEPGSGSELAPTKRRGALTKTLVGVAGLAVLGGAAWGVYAFTSAGPQPATMLPKDTLVYAAIDLDPSGSQKVEAYQFLKRFPAIEDEVNLDSADTMWEDLFDEATADSECDLDYAEDIEPWLGSKAAVAAVDIGEDEPTPTVVVEVKDEDGAEAGFKAIEECSGGEGQAGSWEISGGWAVFAETPDQAKSVVSGAEEASLADDEDFGEWMSTVGDPGIVTFYAAPAAGPWLLDTIGPSLSQQADDAFGTGSADTSSDYLEQYTEACTDAMSEQCQDFLENYDPNEAAETPAADPTIPPEVEKQFKEFGGAAATLGFADDALQLNVAAHTPEESLELVGEESASELVESLPEDTSIAIAASLAEGWLGAALDANPTLTDGVAEFEAQTGLALPEDVEALLGDRFALALGADIDIEALQASPDPSDLPLGLVVDGDADEIEAALDKVRTAAGLPPEAQSLLDSKADGDRVAVSPSSSYRDALLAGGDLGANDAYQSVIVTDEDAASLAFVNFDAGDWLTKLAEGDAKVSENLEPLVAFGVTSWADDDTTHAVIRLSTEDKE